MQVLPGTTRFSKNPLTKEEVEFLKKIESFKFSDDQKLDMLTELAKNILREEQSVIECTKEYLDDGYSEDDSKHFGERHRNDMRADDVIWDTPLDYDGSSSDWIKAKEKERAETNKAQAIAVFIIFIVIVLLVS